MENGRGGVVSADGAKDQEQGVLLWVIGVNKITKPAGEYACLHCNGRGWVESEGPTWKGTKSCTVCHGTGERLVEISLREKELKKRG